jgi:dihydrofolate reductase
MITQYYTAASLDGFIATDDHSLDWLFPLADIEKTSYPSFINEVGALVMGASTYEWLLRHGVKLGSPEEAPWPYNIPTWVLSHRSHPGTAKRTSVFPRASFGCVSGLKKAGRRRNSGSSAVAMSPRFSTLRLARGDVRKGRLP